jgi:hypothetical protein
MGKRRSNKIEEGTMSSIDIDAIKMAPASRRNTVESNNTAKWNCHYCGKNFTHETSYMNHFCKERARYEELRSVVGQAAYSYYCEWMRLYRRKPPSIDTFATSRYYTSFVRFAAHVVKISLPSAEMFIRLMVERDISPTLWTRDQCYSIYLEFYDKAYDPLDQVKVSIETLIDIAKKENIELSDVFVVMGPGRVTDLLRKRKLSPWFIFCSAKFGEFLKNLPPEDWSEMAKVINPIYWSEKLDSNKSLVADIINISNGIGL